MYSTRNNYIIDEKRKDVNRKKILNQLTTEEANNGNHDERKWKKYLIWKKEKMKERKKSEKK